MKIDEWLKTTIPGIVILGALGSILAAGLVSLVLKYVPAFAKSAFEKVLRRTVSHFVFPSIKHAIELHFLATKNKVESFQTLQLMKFLLSLFVSLLALIAFVASLAASPGPILGFAIIVPVVVFFLGIWNALRTMAVIAVPLYFDLESEIEKAKSEAMREAKTDAARKS